MIVVDASVALKWVLDEPGSEAAGELRSETIIAPDFWIIEAANALWRSAKVGQLSLERYPI
ncbi:MAG: type II toxin-antitoxin system VapC family toxin [Alphaproteobacteria bacterium]|nr:type II toxin-antitoxin system VapC family toxin [Alphaproteobacteria bacterium]